MFRMGSADGEMRLIWMEVNWEREGERQRHSTHVRLILVLVWSDLGLNWFV